MSENIKVPTGVELVIRDAILGGWMAGFKGNGPLHHGKEFDIQYRQFEGGYYLCTDKIMEDTMDRRGRVSPAGTCYTYNTCIGRIESMIIDPKWWNAIGKTRSMPEDWCISRSEVRDDVSGNLWKVGCPSYFQHALIDSLRSGGSIESFFAKF